MTIYRIHNFLWLHFLAQRETSFHINLLILIKGHNIFYTLAHIWKSLASWTTRVTFGRELQQVVTTGQFDGETSRPPFDDIHSLKYLRIISSREAKIESLIILSKDCQRKSLSTVVARCLRQKRSILCWLRRQSSHSLSIPFIDCFLL